MQKGIITGCDEKQEWLLKWWWDHYKLHNDLPVTFFDFGMTQKARLFCEERGKVINLKDFIQIDQTNINLKDKKDFELMYGEDRVWNSRQGWFSKPLAALYSPYEFTLWLDLDCEVKKNLNEIFEILECDENIALKPEDDWIQFFSHLTQQSHIDETIYNSGVILFKKNCEMIQEWVKICLSNHQDFAGDQEALSRIIYLKNYKIKKLSEKYNFSNSLEVDSSTFIFHYAGIDGKLAIRSQIKEEEDKLTLSSSKN